MHDYQTKGYTRYGADMGRKSDLDPDTTATLTLRHVPLDEGGYDPGGAYWGGPNDLYMVSDPDGAVGYHRASSPAMVRIRYPKAQWAEVTGEPSESDIREMLDGYIACALWSSTDNSDESGGEPLDANYSETDLSEETRAAMRRDCEAFAKANTATLNSCFGQGNCDWSQAGHDLWLTRNGHGCGFWDGDWPEAEGEVLTKAAKSMGEVNLYVGDDGKLYQ